MGLRVTDSRNFAAGLLYIVFGAGVAYGALGLQIGSPRNMGAGFFPFAVAVALVITGIVVLLGAIHRNAPETGLGSWNLRPILIVCAAVVAFGALLKPAGILIAVPVLIAITTFATKERSIRQYLISVAVLLPLTWALFIAMLGLPIPVLPPFLSN